MMKTLSNMFPGLSIVLVVGKWAGADIEFFPPFAFRLVLGWFCIHVNMMDYDRFTDFAIDKIEIVYRISKKRDCFFVVNNNNIISFFDAQKLVLDVDDNIKILWDTNQKRWIASQYYQGAWVVLDEDHPFDSYLKKENL